MWTRLRLRYLLLAALLGFAGVGAFVFYIFAQATTLKIAVGSPYSDENARLVSGLAQHFGRNKESIRLRIVHTENSDTAAKLLGDSKVDLAIVRSDFALPTNGQTVAIWQRNATLIMSPASVPVTTISSLAQQRIGIIRGQSIPNQKLLERILEQYEVPKTGISYKDIPLPDLQKAIKDKEIDAVMVIGPPAGQLVAQVVATLAESGGGAPHFLSINEADALAQRTPMIERMEVLRGTFGGDPPKPSEPLITVGVSHRLLARDTLSDTVVSELTRLLFAARPALISVAPLANRIEAPDTDKASALPVHPGAASYLDGEQKTFFERYGDWFYIGVMGLSILGSGIAAFASRATAHNQRFISLLTTRLVTIMRSARLAHDEARLDDLDHDIDEIVTQGMAHASDVAVDSHKLEAFNLALNQARHVVTLRRKRLSPTH
jgi:TRAP-type uncharacterized transport system substrate-binding protein